MSYVAISPRRIWRGRVCFTTTSNGSCLKFLLIICLIIIGTVFQLERDIENAKEYLDNLKSMPIYETPIYEILDSSDSSQRNDEYVLGVMIFTEILTCFYWIFVSSSSNSTFRVSNDMVRPYSSRFQNIKVSDFPSDEYELQQFLFK